ncbi:UDP-N-acetylglucosamine 2-epimerase (non-hydrolyzing) [Geobacter pelophilus]|uniref:UDP-N-acetylglucosamine 2-epimerase (non-hydrolyzing) n=1 Tax=Geoanaerobacter pelophilus TaxID=60036 RepID=A0AAW4LG79_9BACT|nr:UDP-N-acetylglucosamine 2-epimerase (non-hydrolyzing) [Geoanaerobacter pelophilus]MBT0666176.1 UDP-N-acetylglucosamine 2-epimerase (non-hydrolyzing) [Geoanaerobacter pelophilus]
MQDLKNKIKVLTVIGTRPEAIKMAPVVKELARYPERIDSRVCVTAQHRQMLDQVLSLFGIVPEYDLDVMRESQSLIQVAANVMTGLEPVLKKVRPDWVLVQGDTTTVAAAAIAAFYCGARVGHVEAGLRTFNRQQPFPEEINRRLAGVLADLHFAPTARARQNLLNEGIPDENILVTGNPVIDALIEVSGHPYDPSSGPLQQIPWDNRLVLVTSHRRENFGAPMEEICQALLEITAACPDVTIVFPVHLNPNVREPVFRILGNVERIILIEPLEYLPLVHLLKSATLVLTDSGGIQEEAPGLGIPVLVLREVTERPEAVEAGTVRVVGTDRARIVTEALRLLKDAEEYGSMSRANNPYGDGRAAERIVDACLEYQGETSL